VDEVWEFVGVPDEEYWSVVSHQIPVSLTRVEFQGEAANISLGVCRSPLTGHCREPQQALCFLAHLGEDLRFGIPGDVLGDFEGPVCPGAFGMNHPLGDSLPVEMGVLLEQLPILDQEGPARTCGQGVLIIRYGNPRRSGEFLLSHP